MLNQIWFCSINVSLIIAVSHIAFITSISSHILEHLFLTLMTSYILKRIQALLFQSLYLGGFNFQYSMEFVIDIVKIYVFQ